MTLQRLIAAFLLVGFSAFPALAVEVQRVVSPGGIEAWLVEDHSNPIISVDFSMVGGAALDPSGQNGLANMAASLIDEGAGALDSQAFQARLADLAIRLSFSSGADTFGGSLRSLTETRDEAFGLLRLALIQPRFDAEPVERIRGQILAGLRSRVEDPNSIAGRTLRQLFFPNHPYGRPVEGTPESVAAITVPDLRAFVRDRFGRDVLKVAVVGDISAKELGPLLDTAFLELPAKAVPADIPEVQPRGAGEVVVIERDIPQSVVVFGHVGLMRDDPDFYAAFVVNHILGGGSFSSRLYQEIRGKRGLAYGVYSYLSPRDRAALIAGGVATANARVAESLDIVRKEWARMAAEGPTAEELEAAKVFLTGSYPLRQRSTGRISGMLLGIQLDRLGIDYINNRNELIESITLEDAKRVARRMLREKALTGGGGGQPEGIEPTRPAPDEGS